LTVRKRESEEVQVSVCVFIRRLQSGRMMATRLNQTRFKGCTSVPFHFGTGSLETCQGVPPLSVLLLISSTFVFFVIYLSNFSLLHIKMKVLC